MNPIHAAQLPTPTTRKEVGTLYLVFFLSLLIVTMATAGMLNLWVDKLFPNPIDSSASDFGSIASLFFWITTYFDADYTLHYLSAIIVSYPLFLVTTLRIKRIIHTSPESKLNMTRKIFVYMTIIDTFLIIVGSTISTLYYCLAGLMTANMAGHFFVTISVAGSLFWYFFTNSRYDAETI